MADPAQPSLFDDPPQETWARPKGATACGRDLTLGPGSCTYWWEGCPRAEKRGCFQLWAARRNGNEPYQDKQGRIG